MYSEVCMWTYPPSYLIGVPAVTFINKLCCHGNRPELLWQHSPHVRGLMWLLACWLLIWNILEFIKTMDGIPYSPFQASFSALSCQCPWLKSTIILWLLYIPSLMSIVDCDLQQFPQDRSRSECPPFGQVGIYYYLKYKKLILA